MLPVHKLKRPTTVLMPPALVAASLLVPACGGSADIGEASTLADATMNDTDEAPTTALGVEETVSASRPDAPSPSPTDPGALGVFFPRRAQPLDEFPMSGLDGELVVDDAGCLRVIHGGAAIMPVWPYEYALGTGEAARFMS